MSYAKTYKFIEIVKDGVDADMPIQLIDLSDTASFPHGRTDRIILKSVQVEAAVSTTGGGAFAIYVGVVTENDSTDGSVSWLRKWDVWAVGDAYTYHEQEWPLAGVDLKVSGGALKHWATNATLDDSAHWKNDAGIVNVNGDTAGNPGVGDLVALIDETANGSTLNARIGVCYDTEDAR